MSPHPSQRSTPSTSSLGLYRTPSASLSAAVAAIRRTPASGPPPALLVATNRLSPSSSRRPPPLSSRSAVISGGSTGFLQTSQRLVHLAPADTGKYCFGLVGSATGPKNRICTALKSFGGTTCGVASHSKKGFVAEDAYYIPVKGKAVLIWPFVLRKHVKLAKAAPWPQCSPPRRHIWTLCTLSTMPTHPFWLT